MFMIFSKGSRTFVLRWKGLTTGTEQQRVVGCLLGFGHDAKEGRSRRPHRRTRRRRVAWPSAVDQRCRLSKEVRGLPATCSQHGEGALHPLAASRHRAVGATPREVAESGPSARPAMASTPSPGWVRARPLLRSPPSHPDLLLCSAPVRTGRLALDPRHPDFQGSGVLRVRALFLSRWPLPMLGRGETHRALGPWPLLAVRHHRPVRRRHGRRPVWVQPPLLVQASRAQHLPLGVPVQAHRRPRRCSPSCMALRQAAYSSTRLSSLRVFQSSAPVGVILAGESADAAGPMVTSSEPAGLRHRDLLPCGRRGMAVPGHHARRSVRGTGRRVLDSRVAARLR